MTSHVEGERRPWGHYQILLEAADHKVKEIMVLPGQRLSLQRHRLRAEYWYVVRGQAVVTRDHEEITLGRGQGIDIPRGSWHRVRNPDEMELVFVEVQTGDYFGEDDIERKEDDYGRV
jgi:mannose-6-phosphate isomerase-like protein (cupin superfamily)